MFLEVTGEMPANPADYQKAYRDKHYAANKQKYIDQAAARKQRLVEEIRELKNVPCADCGQEYGYWVMDFDHRPGEIKLGEVGRFVQNYNRKKALEEVAKCDVVCANCHRERTHARSQAPVAQW